MVIVKEYRIPIPLELEEFRRGQLFAVQECSKNETGGGEGVEFVKQEDFTSTTLVPGKTVTGMYTYKIYRVRTKAPWVLQKLLPPEAFEVHEESWNAYPYSKTILTNPGYMKKDFQVIIETIHIQDNGNSENPLHHEKMPEVIRLNICDDSLITKRDYCQANDPKLFRSAKTKRGPLEMNWIGKNDQNMPIMCAYKSVSVVFKWTGLTGMFEKTIQKQYIRIFTKFHREAWTWIDRYADMTIEEMRKLEDAVAEQLRKQLAEAEKRGTSCEDDKDCKENIIPHKEVKSQNAMQRA